MFFLALSFFYLLLFEISTGEFFFWRLPWVEEAAFFVICSYLFFITVFHRGVFFTFKKVFSKFQQKSFLFGARVWLKRLQVSFVWRSTEAPANTNNAYVSPFLSPFCCNFPSFHFTQPTSMSTLFHPSVHCTAVWGMHSFCFEWLSLNVTRCTVQQKHFWKIKTASA